MDLAEIALFKCYGIIYLPIDAAIYDVLQVSHTLQSTAPSVRPLTTATQLVLNLSTELTVCLCSRKMHLNG